MSTWPDPTPDPPGGQQSPILQTAKFGRFDITFFYSVVQLKTPNFTKLSLFLSLSVRLETAMGVSIHAQKEEDSDYVKAVKT